jgi:hypothetical protein
MHVCLLRVNSLLFDNHLDLILMHLLLLDDLPYRMSISFDVHLMAGSSSPLRMYGILASNIDDLLYG